MNYKKLKIQDLASLQLAIVNEKIIFRSNI